MDNATPELEDNSICKIPLSKRVEVNAPDRDSASRPTSLTTPFLKLRVLALSPKLNATIDRWFSFAL